MFCHAGPRSLVFFSCRKVIYRSKFRKWIATMEKCIVTQSRLLIKQWSFGFIESSPLTRSMKNSFGFAHASSFPLHWGQLYFIGRLWQLLTASNVGARTQAWQAKWAVFKILGFVCKRFLPFFPTPSPLFYLRHFSRGLWLSFLVLCSYTARKRLLRRLIVAP